MSSASTLVPQREPAHGDPTTRLGPRPFRELVFTSVDEFEPGPGWKSAFERLWPSYRSWHLSRGYYGRPERVHAAAALRQHMPELYPLYERLTELAGGAELVGRFLPLWCPPPYILGGSHAVRVDGEPMLVRNYDFSPRLTDGIILRSRWGDRQVIAMLDCLWGCLDGMNDRGLAVSLAFGGRRVMGEGFAVPLILRYVLETASTTAEAAALLSRLPAHMAYTVTVCDASGEHATAMLGPDRPALIGKAPVATNHQGQVEWYKHARATATLERERLLSARLAQEPLSDDALIAAFLEPPVYSRAFAQGFGTQYTAVYLPRRGELTLRWPDSSWTLSFATFPEGVRRILFK
jgi:predicted choloylglycine hydrolase